MTHGELIALAQQRWPMISAGSTKIIFVHRNAVWCMDVERAPSGELIPLEPWIKSNGNDMAIGYSETTDILAVAVNLVDKGEPLR